MINNVYIIYVSVWDNQTEIEYPYSAYIDTFDNINDAIYNGFIHLTEKLNDNAYNDCDPKYRFFIKFNGDNGETIYHYNKDGILIDVSDDDNCLFPTDYDDAAGTHFEIGNIVRNILNDSIYVVAAVPGKRTEENADYWDNRYLVYHIIRYDGLVYYIDHDHIHESHLEKIDCEFDGSILHLLSKIYKSNNELKVFYTITNKEKQELEEEYYE